MSPGVRLCVAVVLTPDNSLERTAYICNRGRLNEIGRLDEGATFLQNVAVYATNPPTRRHILEYRNYRSAMFVNLTTSTVKSIRQHTQEPTLNALLRSLQGYS